MVYDYFKNIEFALPYNLSLFALIPVLVIWYARRKNFQPSLTVTTSRAFTTNTWKNSVRHLPFIFRLLALACLVVVLARPQRRSVDQKSKGEGIDIMLCMDVSGSMSVNDIAPSRLEVAKEVAEEFVRSRPIDRIGLVIFAGKSFTQCPLTNDRNTLIEQIRSLRSDELLDNGTVIGEGLATAVDRISRSTAKSKVIILITDGKEDAPETRLIDPLTALDIAKARGIKVYTIGMGAIPTTGSEMKGKNPAPQRNIDFIDVDLLKKIATETGGQFFRARDKQALEDTYRQIDTLEKSTIEITSTERTEERYLPFLLAALAFVFIEIVLNLTLLRKFP